MGTFHIPPPNIPPTFLASINMMPTIFLENTESYDPWIVPSIGYYLRYDNHMTLSPIKSSYQAIQSETPSPPFLCDTSPDLFHVIFPNDEMIMLFMSMEDIPWDDGHNHYVLFLERDTMESYQWISILSTIVVISYVLESTHDVLYEGNLSNFSPTIPFDILIKPG
jgi:hypothetical protein